MGYKLKVTNGQTRKTNKQNLIDTDNTTVFIRGRGGWEEVEEGKGVINGHRRFDFVWWVHNVNTDDVS